MMVFVHKNVASLRDLESVFDCHVLPRGGPSILHRSAIRIGNGNLIKCRQASKTGSNDTIKNGSKMPSGM